MPVDYNEQLRLSYLQAAAGAVEEQEALVALWRDFYNGDQNILLTDRQKEYLRESFDSFANICKRVVGVVSDRLAIPEDGIQPTDDTGAKYAEIARGWWTDENTSDDGGNNDPYSLQSDVYEAGLRDELTSVIVGWDDANKRPTFTPNLIIDGGNTGLVRFHYDDSNLLTFATKHWVTSGNVDGSKNGKSRLTLYTPGYIERYESDSKWRLLRPDEIDGLPNPQPWTDNGTLNGEPLGIPVIPFENPTGGELADVIAIQELLNHNLGAFDISADLHGYPVLAFFGFEWPIDTATGYADIPKVGPDAAYSGTEDGSIQRVESADLKMMFDSGVISWVQMLTLVKGWPMYLFDRNQQPPSGVALSIMEQSLVNQIKRKQVSFSGSWRAAFNMGRKLHKLHTGEDLPGQVKFNWVPIEVKDPVAEAELLKAEFEAGMYPTITRWRRLGNTKEDIKLMLEDKQRDDDLGLADTITGIDQ